MDGWGLGEVQGRSVRTTPSSFTMCVRVRWGRAGVLRARAGGGGGTEKHRRLRDALDAPIRATLALASLHPQACQIVRTQKLYRMRARDDGVGYQAKGSFIVSSLRSPSR